MSKEEWRDVKGYEGRYQVGSEGNIKSLERLANGKNGSKRTIRGRILKPKVNEGGYLQVSLCDGHGKPKRFLVHRLVCVAFHGKPKNKYEVNHINEDKLDNRACNLEWVTAKENTNHGTRNARVANALSKQVGQYTTDGKLIKVWQSLREVERRLGFDHGHISAVALGKARAAYGYVWKYFKTEK